MYFGFHSCPLLALIQSMALLFSSGFFLWGQQHLLLSHIRIQVHLSPGALKKIVVKGEKEQSSTLDDISISRILCLFPPAPHTQAHLLLLSHIWMKRILKGINQRKAILSLCKCERDMWEGWVRWRWEKSAKGDQSRRLPESGFSCIEMPRPGTGTCKLPLGKEERSCFWRGSLFGHKVLELLLFPSPLRVARLIITWNKIERNHLDSYWKTAWENVWGIAKKWPSTFCCVQTGNVVCPHLVCSITPHVHSFVPSIFFVFAVASHLGSLKRWSPSSTPWASG